MSQFDLLKPFDRTLHVYKLFNSSNCMFIVSFLYHIDILPPRHKGRHFFRRRVIFELNTFFGEGEFFVEDTFSGEEKIFGGEQFFGEDTFFDGDIFFGLNTFFWWDTRHIFRGKHDFRTANFVKGDIFSGEDTFFRTDLFIRRNTFLGETFSSGKATTAVAAEKIIWIYIDIFGDIHFLFIYFPILKSLPFFLQFLVLWNYRSEVN